MGPKAQALMGLALVMGVHRALREPFADHLALYFGDACDRAAIDRLGPRDQEGIRTGTVSPGMTKRGVIFALGYPPSHANPGTDADEWRYWQNRFRTFVVHFEDGRVARVQH